MSKPVLFAHDTSMLIKNPSFLNFRKEIIKLYELLNKWFSDNLFALNFEKTYFLQFTTKNRSLSEINTNYNNKYINNTFSTHFLGIAINNTLSC
jgi:hypothetical protein